MTDFEHVPDKDAVFFEFRARQLVPRLQTLRDCILALKEEAMDAVKQQWARSKKDQAIATFALADEGITKVEDELAQLLYHIRALKACGQADQNTGITELDV